MIVWTALGAAFAAPADEVPAVDEPVVEGEEPVASGPDRSAPPEVVPPEPLELPEPEVHELAPGVRAWHVRVPSVRKLVVHVVLERGLIDLVGGPTQQGRATGWMADVAAGDYGAAELSLTKDLNEVDLWSTIGLHDGRVSMVVPAVDATLGLELQELVLHEPTFPKKDLKRYLRDQELFYLVEGPSSQRRVADSALGFAWFPADHPYGRRPDLAELDGIKPGGLDALWSKWVASGPITAVVVGDVPWSDVEGPLKRALSGLGADVPRSEPLEVPAREGTRVIAVDMPGQEQVAVRFRSSGPPEGHADRVAMTATNWVLGGHFLSRLNQILREERGYTYGSYSSYNHGPTWGSVTVNVDVGTSDLAETVQVIEEQVADLASSGVTAEELETARRSLVQEWNLSFQNAERAAGVYLQALDEGTSVADMRARRSALADLTPDDAQRTAQEWLSADKPRLWVLVGDRATMEPELAEAGLVAEWLDPRQAILGNF